MQGQNLSRFFNVFLAAANNIEHNMGLLFPMSLELSVALAFHWAGAAESCRQTRSRGALSYDVMRDVYRARIYFLAHQSPAAGAQVAARMHV